MAYTINRTDGSLFATVANGTIDNTTSSLVIVGKNYAGYGEALNENFVRLLESNANPTAPTAPQLGQLWYNSSANALTVYNGTEFKDLASSATTATEPTAPAEGDLWYDTVNSQLHVYDGAQFILVGPAFSSGTGTTGSVVEVITDTLAVDHVVISLYVNDDIVAIISKDAEFTPASVPTGFAATIKTGIQLADAIAGEFPQFVGDATNALLLDGNAASDFLSAIADDTTTGTLGILNDTGLTVGVGADAKLSVTGSDVILENITSNGDLVLRVNDGGVPTEVITIDGTSARARVSSPIVGTDIANADYVTSQISYKGGYDATGNTPDLDTAPSGIIIGDTYTVTVAGTFFSTPVAIGDVLIAEVTDADAEVEWTIIANGAASIKTLYESNADTNALTDAGLSTLSDTVTISGTQTITGSKTYTALQKWAKGADVASAAALTVGSDGNYFDITGTTAITSITTAGIGTVIKLHFDAILTLTHQATDLILPGAANITTAAGDEAEFVEYAAGDWRCTSYHRASEIGDVIILDIPELIASATPTIGVWNAVDSVTLNTAKAKKAIIRVDCRITETNTISLLANASIRKTGSGASNGTIIARGISDQDSTASPFIKTIDLAGEGHVNLNASFDFDYMINGNAGATITGVAVYLVGYYI